MIRFANLKTSPRLQRVHALLSDGEEHSTREISIRCDVYGISAIVSELRAQGAEIGCRRAGGGGREPIWLYRMTRPAGVETQDPAV